MRFVKMYLSFARVTIRSTLAHRSSYWAGVVAQWAGYGASFATLYILVSSFDTLAGWNAYEILFMYALNLLSYAIGATFFFMPCVGLSQKVRSGEFDSALTKPVSPFVHELYQGFNMAYISHITLSLAVMILTSVKVGLMPNLITILTLIGMLAGAALIQAAFLIAASSASFFMINENPFFGIFWDIKDFTNYPISIYHFSIQVVLTVFLPVAFISFYPAAALLRLPSGTPFPGSIGFLTPIVGGVLFILSILLWNLGLSKYQSSGS